jgi:hypothetical protein
VRYSPRLRERMPRVDLDTVTFETARGNRSRPDGTGWRRSHRRSAGGAAQTGRGVPGRGPYRRGRLDIDNLSLSDRRAESVAVALTQQFRVRPRTSPRRATARSILKVPTQAAERQNRRVTARRITPLLAGGAQPGG